MSAAKRPRAPSSWCRSTDLEHATDAWPAKQLLFDDNELQTATLAYERAAADTQHQLNAFAEYKYAGAVQPGEYSRDPQDARRARAHHKARHAGEQDERDPIVDADEALENLAMFYTEAEDPSKAEDFLHLVLGKRQLIHLPPPPGRCLQAAAAFRASRCLLHAPQGLPSRLRRPDLAARARPPQRRRDNLEGVRRELAKLMANYTTGSEW